MRLNQVVAAAVAVLAICCGASAAAGNEAEPKIRIVASVFPLQEFARAVAGEYGDVSLLLPPGAGVHTWQPRASDIIRLSTADLFIYIGAGLEPWLDDVLRSLTSSRLRVLVVMDSLSLPGPEKKEHEEDPHIWLDLGIDRSIVSLLARTLGQIAPAQAIFFAANAERYAEKLEKIEEQFSTVLSRCRQRTILLGGHAAFGYLAARYGLEQKSLSGLSPDAEPTPGRLMEAIKWAKQNGVRAVFREANANDKMARLLAKEIGAELLVLHPGANLSKKEWSSGLTFLDIMARNLDNLKRGLGCD
jgi:zinc transport system substrate-binding protein